MYKFIATQDLVKTVAACTSQAQIEQVIRPQRWEDCQFWFTTAKRSTPSGATLRGEKFYSDGTPIDMDENKALVRECIKTGGGGYSTAIVNSAKSALKSFKNWGWSPNNWELVLDLEWNGTGRQGSPRVEGFSVESEMLWTKHERACQKFAKLLRQIKAYKGEPIPAFEKLCYQPAPAPQPAPVAQPVAPAPQPQPKPKAEPTQTEDWRVVALKAAIKAGASTDAIGKMAMSLFA